MQGKNIHLVDAQEYIGTLRNLVEEGHKVSLVITGSSMSPFLVHGRDKIYFVKPDRELKRGDMVFYQRDNGQYVMHRIYRIKDGEFYMIGDAQTEVEGPLRRNQIFARVIEVERRGKLTKEGDFWWWFFEKIWLRIIPLRRSIVAVYRYFHEYRKKTTGKE